MNFEENLKQLEDIVEKLSSDNIELQHGAELYSKAMELIKSCENYLKEAKGKIEIIDSAE